MSTSRTLSNLLKKADSPYSRLIERSRLHKELQSRLESILGADAAAHYRIQNLRDGLLILQTDASSWAARMRFELPKVLERLRIIPGLRQLRDVQIRVVMPENSRTITPRRAHLSREATIILEEAAAATPDPLLQNALRRLARHGRG